MIRLFGNFPHTLGTLGCVENCQNFIKLHQVGCGNLQRNFFLRPGFWLIGGFTKYRCCNASKWPQMHQKYISGWNWCVVPQSYPHHSQWCLGCVILRLFAILVSQPQVVTYPHPQPSAITSPLRTMTISIHVSVFSTFFSIFRSARTS